MKVVQHYWVLLKKRLPTIFLIFLMFFCTFSEAYSQKEGQELIDSLFTELPTLSEDTNKVKTLAYISYELADFDLEKGVEVGKQALQLAEELKYDFGIATSKLSLSRNYFFQSKRDLVMENASDAANIFQEIKDTERLCATYCLLCTIISPFDQSTGRKYYNKAKSLLLNIKDDKWKRTNLSWILSMSKIYERDSTYLIMKQYQQLERLSNSKIALASSFAASASYYQSKNDIDSALFFCKKADTILLKLQLKRKLAGNYRTMGRLFLKKENDDASAMINQEKAEEYFKRSIILAEEFGSIMDIYFGYMELSQLQKDLGKSDLALLSHEKFMKNYMEWNRRNNAGRIAYISFRYEIDLKEKDLEILQIQNKKQLTVIISGIIIVSILILLTIFWRKNLLLKQRESDHQLILLEQKTLQSMMNPHFIFNTLGSIQNYLLQSKSEEAGLYLSQFARLIRLNISSINSALISLDEEVNRLKIYMDLEQLRTDNKFEYIVEFDQGIDEEEVYIPSMIIQPFVENSIWHGISAIEGKGMIQISFSMQSAKAINIVVEDNGVGIIQSKKYSSRSEDHLHLSMEMIRKRLEILGKKMKVKTGMVTCEATPGNDNPGTRVVLTMPFSKNENGT